MLTKIWNWIKSLFIKKPKTTIYNVPTMQTTPEIERFKHTKAYADERQKIKKNRSRKPSKAMRNLYHLG